MDGRPTILQGFTSQEGGVSDSLFLCFNFQSFNNVLRHLKAAYDNELHNSYHVCTVMLYVHTNSS